MSPVLGQRQFYGTAVGHFAVGAFDEQVQRGLVGEVVENPAQVVFGADGDLFGGDDDVAGLQVRNGGGERRRPAGSGRASSSTETTRTRHRSITVLPSAQT